MLPQWNLILFLLRIFKGGYSYKLKGSDGVRHKNGIGRELLETPTEGCSTVHELMQESFKNFGSQDEFSEEQLNQVFQMFDLNHSGLVGKEDMTSFVTTFFEDIVQKETKKSLL